MHGAETGPQAEDREDVGLDIEQSNSLYYDIWSNIHYGYVGRAAGFDPKTLQEAAASGIPIADKTDVGDRTTVQIGIGLYERYKPDRLMPERINKAILDAIPQFQPARARQLRPS